MLSWMTKSLRFSFGRTKSSSVLIGGGILTVGTSVLWWTCAGAFPDLRSLCAMIVHIIIFISTNTSAAAAITIISYLVIARLLYSSARNIAAEMLSRSSLSFTRSISSRSFICMAVLVVTFFGERRSSISSFVMTWRKPSEHIM